MSSQEKVELLQKIETLAKKKDPRISQVMASISGSFSIVVILTDKGLITDLRPSYDYLLQQWQKKPERIWGKWRWRAICYE